MTEVPTRKPEGASLRAQLRRVGGRLMLVGASAGALWGLSGALTVLTIGAWIDLLWELTPHLRITVWIVSVTGSTLLVGYLVRKTARAARAAAIARRLDQAAATGGAILTGLDLDEPGAGVQVERAVELTTGLARLAVDRAADLAVEVALPRAVPGRPVKRSLALLGIVALAVGLVFVCVPRLAWTQWSRFADPFGDVPPFSWTQFEVSPGDTKVLYGSEQEITVRATGRPVEEVGLVLRDPAGREESIPMFPESDGRWRAVLSSVTEPATYHARSYRSRSRRYRIDVITVPRIEEVRFRITPPDYTRMAPYEGPMPADGLVGLPGARVEVRARSNRPLSGGKLSLVPANSGDVSHKADQVKMTPVAAEANEVRADFEIQWEGKFELKVIDVGGQPSLESFSGAIVLLADQRPFVRLTQPKPVSLATPNTVLPVVSSAEDDYGISRLELYRSLNGSRPSAMDVRLAEPPPRRAYESVYLPLDQYGLTPGDEIKLFARVTDNDPAGAKGAESSVVLVRIISQEEFERMLRVREGINVLLSKYREARRRLEQLAEEMEKLRKKATEASPDNPISQELREEFGRMLARLGEESRELQRLADQDLPFDIDKHLSPLLEKLASAVDGLLDQTEHLASEPDLKADRLARQLMKLIEELSGRRGDFQQQATEPLEMLDAVMPLIADEARFVRLVLRQMDLADRMAALEGRDGEDEPTLRARMRDLEEEQQAVRSDLNTLVEDILDHVEALPDDPELERLRKSAQKFVRDLEASGAAEAMNEAEAALAEFSGSRAYRKAKEAAEILKSFLAFCRSQGGMGNSGRACLEFQPALSQGLGDSIDQLLAAMGLGSGAGGFGAGSGGQGGYSAVRGPGQNVGLYGSMPGAGQDFGQDSGAGRTSQAYDGDARVTGARFSNPDVDTWIDTSGQEGAGGVGEGAVPIRYRSRVNRYFQRLAEEIGN